MQPTIGLLHENRSDVERSRLIFKYVRDGRMLLRTKMFQSSRRIN